MQDPQWETLPFLRFFSYVPTPPKCLMRVFLLLGRLNQHIIQHEWISQWVTFKTTITHSNNTVKYNTAHNIAALIYLYTELYRYIPFLNCWIIIVIECESQLHIPIMDYSSPKYRFYLSTNYGNYYIIPSVQDQSLISLRDGPPKIAKLPYEWFSLGFMLRIS